MCHYRLYSRDEVSRAAKRQQDAKPVDRAPPAEKSDAPSDGGERQSEEAKTLEPA